MTSAPDTKPESAGELLRALEEALPEKAGAPGWTYGQRALMQRLLDALPALVEYARAADEIRPLVEVCVIGKCPACAFDEARAKLLEALR